CGPALRRLAPSCHPGWPVLCTSVSPAPPPRHRVLFLVPGSPRRRALHSFPTRRSSDLGVLTRPDSAAATVLLSISRQCLLQDRRSEEHTSELQSREKLVCRLLLEKKKAAARATQSRSLGAFSARGSGWATVRPMLVEMS